mgnify:FL=1
MCENSLSISVGKITLQRRVTFKTNDFHPTGLVNKIKFEFVYYIYTMSTNCEDTNALLNKILYELNNLKNDVSELKNDVSELKNDVSHLDIKMNVINDKLSADINNLYIHFDERMNSLEESIEETNKINNGKFDGIFKTLKNTNSIITVDRLLGMFLLGMNVLNNYTIGVIMKNKTE